MSRRPLSVLAVAFAVAAASPSSTAGHAEPGARRDSTAAIAVSPGRFACYPAQFGSFRARRLSVVDRFGAAPLVMTVRLPEAACAPAAAPGGALAGSTSYLTCYRATTSRRFQRTLTLRDAVGTSRVSVLGSSGISLCTPSARLDGGRTGTPSSAFTLLTCYATRPAPTSAVRGTVSREGVATVDDFGRAEDSLRGPSRVCSPAVTSSASSLLRRPLLTCYDAESSAAGTAVVLRDALGLLRAALGPRTSVCVVVFSSS